MTEATKERIRWVASFLATEYGELGWEDIKQMEGKLTEEQWQYLCDEFAQSLAEIYQFVLY